MQMAVVRLNTGVTLNGVTDSQLNSGWVVQTPITVGAVQTYFCFCPNTLGGTKNNITFAFSGASSGVVPIILEFTGLFAFVQKSVGATGTSTSPLTAAITPSLGNTLVAFFGMQGVSGTVTAGLIGGNAGTLRAQGTAGGTTVFTTAEDTLVTSATSSTAAITIPSSSWMAGLVEFSSSATIAGNTGTPGVTVAWSGTASGSVVSDGSGNYVTSALGPGSYTITPTLSGFSFTPASQLEVVSGTNITGVNFTATAVKTGRPARSK